MFLFLFFMLFSVGLFAQECGVSIDNALDFKGEEITVCGVVSQVSTPNSFGDPTYLNFGGYFPNHKFTAVLWGRNKHNFKDNLKIYAGKRVAVTGVIQEYAGLGQIVLVYPDQIELVE